MRTQNIFCLLSFWCIISFPSLYAQNTKTLPDSLTAKIIHYGLKNTPSTLFTVFDKNVYVNNESVWFTAYVLNYAVKTNKPTILSVILVDDSCRTIVLEEKYGITDGLAFGHVMIPDSIPTGDYSLITYTNILTNGMPQDIFIQPITIKEQPSRTFFASLKLLDTTKTPDSDGQKVVLKMENLAHQPIAGATVSWIIGDMEDRKFWGTVKTDKDGKYVFSIPRNQIIKGKNVLNVSAIFLSDVRNIKIVLPIVARQLNVKFYPEGGELVNGIQSFVGWETKTANGAPLKIKGVLYKDEQAVDTILTDQYGMGKFKFTPAVRSAYTVKIINDDSNYVLPRILPTGAVLSLKKAVLNDSLQMTLISNCPQKYLVVVHNYKQVFYSFPIEGDATGKLINVNLQDLPKGLSAVTVLDSLQRPCAERIFFTHYNQRNTVKVVADYEEYSTRKKVKVKLRLNSANIDSAKAIVTVACVQSSRIQLKKANDIASYIYLKNELETLPIKENYMGQSRADKDYLEKVLLIKGWRRYKWQEIMVESGATDSDRQIKIMIGGKISYKDKPLKKEINIMIKTDSATNILKTDAYGNFRIDENSVFTNERKKVNLLLNYEANGGYKIKMINIFRSVNDSLINNFRPVNYNLLQGYIINTDNELTPGLRRVIKLKEVKILGMKDDAFGKLSPPIVGIYRRVNDCGDYVCPYNILNCSNHVGNPYNTLPVIGKYYFINDSWAGAVYKGCKVTPNQNHLETLSFTGINYPAEFYGPDYTKFNPSEPENETTIYFKHTCYLNSQKETELSFYTSDITGQFDVIVQGVSSDDLIYQKIEFNVKKQ